MKSKKLGRHNHKKNPPYGSIFIGAGLLTLGIVAALMLSQPDNASSSAGSVPQSNEISVVPAAVNFAAPELSLSDLNGKQSSLADYRGKVVLVNNWATWCPPCKAEMPTLLAYYEKYKDQGFVLIGIEAGEPADEVAKFVAEYKLTFPIWLDPNNRALTAFQNQGLPNSYVIDEQGVVRLAWTGAINTTMLEKYVTPLLED